MLRKIIGICPVGCDHIPDAGNVQHLMRHTRKRSACHRNDFDSLIYSFLKGTSRNRRKYFLFCEKCSVKIYSDHAYRIAHSIFPFQFFSGLFPGLFPHPGFREILYHAMPIHGIMTFHSSSAALPYRLALLRYCVIASGLKSLQLEKLRSIHLSLSLRSLSASVSSSV